MRREDKHQALARAGGYIQGLRYHMMGAGATNALVLEGFSGSDDCAGDLGTYAVVALCKDTASRLSTPTRLISLCGTCPGV